MKPPMSEKHLVKSSYIMVLHGTKPLNFKRYKSIKPTTMEISICPKERKDMSEKPTLIHLFNEVELMNPLLMAVQGLFWMCQLAFQFPVCYLLKLLTPKTEKK